MESMSPQIEEFEKYMTKWIKDVVNSYKRNPLDVYNSKRKDDETDEKEETDD